VPIVRDDEVKAVVVGNVTPDSVIANVKSIHPTPLSFGMLVDSRGRIVVHPDSDLRLKPVTNVAAEIGGTKPGWIAAKSANRGACQR
jgi:methyl-accepting chemotaxis protein